MASSSDQLVEHLQNQPSADWLRRFLLHEELTFSAGDEHFPDRASYLVNRLRRDDKELARNVSQATIRALEQLRRDGQLRLYEPATSQSPLTSQLLYLLECLPPHNADAATDLLKNLHGDKELTQWPGNERDAHRQILLALASNLGKATNQRVEFWEARLEEDLNNPRYAVSAFLALANCSRRAAVDHIRHVLLLLKNNKIPFAPLLIAFCRLAMYESAELWQRLGQELRGEALAAETKYIVSILHKHGKLNYAELVVKPPQSSGLQTQSQRSLTLPIPSTRYQGTGRRKKAVARVLLRVGRGEFSVNNRSVEDYFSKPQDRQAVYEALRLTEMKNRLDVSVKVHGGGMTGQSGAILQGVARALKEMFTDIRIAEAADAEDEDDAGGFEESTPLGMIRKLRDSGFLTRDSRMKERKKYGRKGARKGTQFSKR